MVFRFKCAGCDHIYVVDLGKSEYYLPMRCPDCGYLYHDVALRTWLDEVKRMLEQEKRPY